MNVDVMFWSFCESTFSQPILSICVFCVWVNFSDANLILCPIFQKVVLRCSFGLAAVLTSILASYNKDKGRILLLRLYELRSDASCKFSTSSKLLKFLSLINQSNPWSAQNRNFLCFVQLYCWKSWKSWKRLAIIEWERRESAKRTLFQDLHP